jgi:hypothetical protein
MWRIVHPWFIKVKEDVGEWRIVSPPTPLLPWLPDF